MLEPLETRLLLSVSLPANGTLMTAIYRAAQRKLHLMVPPVPASMLQCLSPPSASTTYAPVDSETPFPASYDWHTQTLDGVLNLWTPDPADFDATFTMTDSTALFGPDGVPQIDSIHQGPTADCYFLAAAGAMAYSNPSRIQALVKNDTIGGWAATFQYFNSPTGACVPVVIHTNNRLSSTLQTVSNDEVWPLVLEKAFAAFRTWNGTSSTNTMASLNWGFAGSALEALNDTYQNIPIAGRTEQWIYSTLQAALAAGQPIDFHTASTATTMVPSHVYVITAISTDASETRWITTYNPWGFYETRTVADLLLNSTGSVVIGAP